MTNSTENFNITPDCDEDGAQTEFADGKITDGAEFLSDENGREGIAAPDGAQAAKKKNGLDDLTQGSLIKKIFIFSLPLVLSNVLQVLFNMADVAVVGRFGRDGSLGAVGSTTTIVAMFTGVLLGVGGGINAIVARYYGAKNADGVKKSVHSALLISLIVGAVLLGIGVGFSRPILKLLGTKDEFLDGATLYLRIYFLGMPALAAYNCGNGIFSAIGNTRRPLAYLIVAGIINVILNLFFVIVVGIDVAGVGIASIISQYVSGFLVLFALFRKRDECYGLSFRSLRFSSVQTREIVALGLASGLQNAIFQLANLFTQSGVNSFDPETVEGSVAAQNADALVYDVMAAFYTACSSFMAQAYGAGKRDRVVKSYFISMGYAFLIAAVMGAALVLFGEAFLALFTSKPIVVERGMDRLRVMGLSYAISAFMDCTIAASRGLGKSLVPSIIVIMGSCVFRIVWIFTIFAHFHTIISLYLLYPCSWAITAIAEIVYFAILYHKTFPKNRKE